MAEVKLKSSLDNKYVEEPKKVEQIVTSPVKMKKRSFWDKVHEEFISEDGKSVGDYILLDVLVPAIKKTISDIVTNGIDMILFGGTRSSNNSLPGTRVSYRTYYDSNQRNSGGYSRNRAVSSNYTYDQIIFQNRGDADAVLNELNEIIRRYGFAKVADFNDLAGVNGSYTDNNYGWSDLRFATIQRQRDGGYLIDLPKPMPID